MHKFALSEWNELREDKSNILWMYQHADTGLERVR